MQWNTEKNNDSLIKASQRVKRKNREESKANILPTRRSRRVASIKEEEIENELKLKKITIEENEDEVGEEDEDEDDYRIKYDSLPEAKEDFYSRKTSFNS